jgi:hypothetical protein
MEQQTAVTNALIMDELIALARDHRSVLCDAIDHAVANLEHRLQDVINLHGVEAVRSACCTMAKELSLG